MILAGSGCDPARTPLSAAQTPTGQITVQRSSCQIDGLNRIAVHTAVVHIESPSVWSASTPSLQACSSTSGGVHVACRSLVSRIAGPRQICMIGTPVKRGRRDKDRGIAQPVSGIQFQQSMWGIPRANHSMHSGSRFVIRSVRGARTEQSICEGAGSDECEPSSCRTVRVDHANRT